MLGCGAWLYAETAYLKSPQPYGNPIADSQSLYKKNEQDTDEAPDRGRYCLFNYDN